MPNMTVDEQKATFHSFVAVGLFEACTTNSNGNPAYIHVIFVRIMAECLYLLLRNMYEVSLPSTCVEWYQNWHLERCANTFRFNLDSSLIVLER